MAPKPKGKPKGTPARKRTASAAAPSTPAREPLRVNGILCWPPVGLAQPVPLTAAELVQYQDTH